MWWLRKWVGAVRPGRGCGVLAVVLLLMLPGSAAARESAVSSVDQAAPPHRAPHVPWLEDLAWPEIVQRAREGSRPILIDFYARWCGPCRALDAMVYNEGEVIAELKDVVTFKVDVDKPRYADLKERFGVTRLPTLVWCTPEGDPFARFTGYVTADTFLARVGRWRRDLARERELLARLGKSPDDPLGLAAAYGERLRRGKEEEAGQLRERLLRLVVDAPSCAVAEGLLAMSAVDTATGGRQRAATMLRCIEGMFPESPWDLDRRIRGERMDVLGRTAAFQWALADTLGLLATYSRMIFLDRGCLPALEGFARTALAADTHLPQATTCALRAVIRSDERPDLLALLAACYQRRSFHARAVKWMRKAVAADPDNDEFRATLAAYRATCPSWLLDDSGASSP